jgi:hypothetical protein
MTKISNLYSLTNYITANSSGNVVIATPTSGFALDVTGTGRFTGALTGTTVTFTNTYSNTSDMQIVANGNISGINIRSTQGGRLSIVEGFVAADTTSFLTSTGTNNPSVEAIRIANGTGAITFTSNITSNGNVISNGGVVASLNGGSIEVYNTGNSNYFDLKSVGGNFALRTNVGAGAVNALTIASGGAATFASSVTATQSLILNGTNPNFDLQNSGTTRFRAELDGSNFTYLSTFGANDMILRTNGTARLTLNGTTGAATFSSSVTASTFTSNLTSGVFLNNSSGGTNATQLRINNTSGDLRLGIESSTGATIQLGTLAYAAVFGNQANNATQFTTNGTARMTIISGGTVLVNATSQPGYGGVFPKLEVAQTSVSNTDGDGGTLALYGISSSAINTGAALVLGQAYSGTTTATGARVRSGKENATSGDFASYLALDTRPNGGGLTERMRITSGGTLQLGNGGAQNNVFRSLLEDTTNYSTQFYNSNNKNTFFIGGGSSIGYNEGALIALTGSDRYGTYTAGMVTIAAGNAVNNTSFGFIELKTANSVRMTISYNGNIGMPSTYGFTTSNAANLFIDSGAGLLYRSTSSLKYKTNVRNYDKGLDILSQMRPVYYEGIGVSDSNKTFAGLIAEEVHDLGLTEFVQYAEDGTPDALAYQNMVSLLIKGIQELSAKVTALENK